MIYIELSLALASWALVAVTVWLARSQSRSIRTDLRARLQLAFTDRFDGPRLAKARKELASYFLTTPSPGDRHRIDETLMNFFEDLGLFARRDYLDRELIWSTFGFYAVRWWAACKGYVLEERRLEHDASLFDQFEYLAMHFVAHDAEKNLEEPTPSDLKRFLEDERDL